MWGVQMHKPENHQSCASSGRSLRSVALASIAAVLALHAGASIAGEIDPNNLKATATMTFDAEFNRLNLWNGKTPGWDTNYWYNPLHGNGGSLSTNGEQEWYINYNDPKTKVVKPWHVANGIMTLTGNPAPRNIQPLINGYQYTSGEINSYHAFHQEYGFFQIRCKLPAGQGTWPAFWLLPENGSWPPEIDILEVLGQQPTVLYTSAHGEQNGQETNYGTATTVPDTSKAFHTYAVDWEPDYLTWYFDGRQVYRLKTPPGFNTPMYIEANLALGGYWGGDVNNTTPFPSNMQIDFIRVYKSRP
jgi:beta-glucanase (GH16 family)